MMNIWEDFNWDNPTIVLSHLPVQDVRKYEYLASVGHAAIPEKTVFAAPTSEEDIKFAMAWADLLTDYPTADIVYDTTGDPPTAYQGSVQYAGIRPGTYIVYFERSFTHPIAAAVNGEFKFAATLKSVYGIYNENGSTIDIDGTLEQWYEEQDDFRPGTPFIVKAGGSDNTQNNGFYRVRSVRYESGYVYVTPDNNKYEQQTLIDCSYSSTNAVCDFGGDWYVFMGMNGNSLSSNNRSGGHMSDYLSEYGDNAYIGTVRDRWWSNKDLYHRYVGNVFGPNDGRPPTGGQMSKDFNADWVRAINPNLYHSYDKNSHRFHIEAETDGTITGGDYEQFTALIPAAKFLSFQADPKEIESPAYYEDHNRLEWKYGGKVKIKASDITDPSSLGPIQSVRKLGWVSTSNNKYGTSSDHQYCSTYIREGASSSMYTEDGYLPFMSGQSYETKWKDLKYNDALQNTVERICSEKNWLYPVDDDFKYNWIWVNKYQVITSALEEWLLYDLELDSQYFRTDYELTATYWDVYTEFGLAYAYNALYDTNQYQYAYMNDEYWGENGSAFELILKLLGANYYDWFCDYNYPYRCKRLLDQAWVGEASESTIWWNETYTTTVMNGVTVYSVADGGTNPKGAAYDACYPTPVATWRRTWKLSLGRVHNIFMRDGSRGEPIGAAIYEYYSVLANESTDNKTIRMIGRVVMDTPTIDNTPIDSDFYTWSKTGWTTEDTNLISFTGDQTSYIKSGYIVWAKISGEYYAYPVLRAWFDGSKTLVRFSSAWTTNTPSTIYGDINLSEHHDACMAPEGHLTWSIDRIYSIIARCRMVLRKLEYKNIDVSISYVGNQTGSYPYGEVFATQAALLARYIADVDDTWDDDVTNWATWNINNPGGITVGISAGYYHYIAYGADEWSQTNSLGTARQEFAIKIATGTFYDKNAVTFLHKLKFRRNLAYGPVESQFMSPSSLVIQGMGEMTLPAYDAPYQNIYIPCKAEENEVVYIKIYMTGGLDNWIFIGETWAGQEWVTFTLAVCYASTNVGPDFAGRFDWDSYSDQIWKRTVERLDYKLYDYMYDTKAPVTDNRFIELPEMYDAALVNVVQQSLAGTDDDADPYLQPSYTPDIRIRSSCALMEDLEGNGVKYIFTDDFSVSLMEKVQTSREYDEKIFLDISGTAGGIEQQVALIIEEIWDTLFQVNSRDEAGILGPSNNTGIACTGVGISFKNIPVLPLQAQWPDGYDSWYTNPIKLVVTTTSGTENYFLFVTQDGRLPANGDLADAEFWTLYGGTEYKYGSEYSSEIQRLTAGDLYDALPAVWKTNTQLFIVNLDTYTSFPSASTQWKVRFVDQWTSKNGIWSSLNTVLDATVMYIDLT